VRAPSPKITKAKWTGAVAQAVELLLCKWEALSSNPNPTKKIIFQVLYVESNLNVYLFFLLSTYCVQKYLKLNS
jgi:hypothetical protein